MRIYVTKPAFYQKRRLRPGMIVEWNGKNPPSWGVEKPTHQEITAVEGDLTPRTLHEIQTAPVTVTAGPGDTQIKAAPPASSGAKPVEPVKTPEPVKPEAGGKKKTTAKGQKPPVESSTPPVFEDDLDDDNIV